MRYVGGEIFIYLHNKRPGPREDDNNIQKNRLLQRVIYKDARKVKKKGQPKTAKRGGGARGKKRKASWVGPVGRGRRGKGDVKQQIV